METRNPPGLRATFLAHFVVSLIVGLIYLLIPQTWSELIRWPETDVTMLRLFGAAILGYCTTSWLAYREPTWQGVKIVLQMEIVWTILGALVTLWGLIFASVPPFGWVYVALFAGFAAVFVVYYARQSAAARLSTIS